MEYAIIFSDKSVTWTTFPTKEKAEEFLNVGSVKTDAEIVTLDELASRGMSLGTKPNWRF